MLNGLDDEGASKFIMHSSCSNLGHALPQVVLPNKYTPSECYSSRPRIPFGLKPSTDYCMSVRMLVTCFF